jgi:hypothetical protein
MVRQKPNKTSKPPHKQTEEQDKQPNTDPSTKITPQSAKARKKTTGTIEQSENPQTKTLRTPTQAIFVNNDPTLTHFDKLEREEELKRQEESPYQDDDESLQTVDKFEHRDTNTEDTLTSPQMRDKLSPDKSDCKEAAHADSDASSPSTKTRQKTSHRKSKSRGYDNWCFTMDETKATLYHGGDTFKCEYRRKTKIPTIGCLTANTAPTQHIPSTSMAKNPNHKGCKRVIFHDTHQITTPAAYNSNLNTAQQELLHLHET